MEVCLSSANTVPDQSILLMLLCQCVQGQITQENLYITNMGHLSGFLNCILISRLSFLNKQ